jgi:hypothetical protein
MLKNISDASIEEITGYLKRAVKIYVLLVILNIYYSVNEIVDHETEAAVWGCTVTVLYVLYLISLMGVTHIGDRPILCVLHVCSGALVLLIAFSAIQMTYLLYDEPKNYFILLQLLGILIELSTLFIHYHLSLKLRSAVALGQENLLDPEPSV